MTSQRVANWQGWAGHPEPWNAGWRIYRVLDCVLASSSIRRSNGHPKTMEHKQFDSHGIISAFRLPLVPVTVRATSPLYHI